MFPIRVVRGLFAGLVLSVTFSASAFSVHDGLLFDLGLLNPSSAATNPATNNIVNRTTWSAPVRETASEVSTFKGGAHPECGTPAPIGHGTMEIRHPYHYYEGLQTYPVLTFPVNTNYVAATGKTYIYPQVVTFPKPIYSGSNVTIYIRFKIDGCLAYKGSTAYIRYLWDNVQTVKNPSTGKNEYIGWRIAYQASPENPNSTYYLRNWIGDSNYLDYGFPISRGVWYAMVCCFETDPATGNVTLRSYKTQYDNSPRGETHDATSLTSTTYKFTQGRSIAVPPETAGKSYLGGRAIQAGYTDWAEINQDRVGFCGSIAEARVYNRALSKAEVLTLLAQADGATFATGSANGSADEFAAEDDPAVAEVFEPKSMTPRQMRKSLTAAHPSLTLKVPVPTEEEGLVKQFRMVTLLDGTGESAPYDLLVNGTKIAAGDFARARGGDLYLRNGQFRRGDDGYLTIQVRRTGILAGAVLFDALTLTGAWAGGARSSTYTSNAFRDVYYLFANHTSNAMMTPTGGTPGQPYLYNKLWGKTATGTWYAETTICFDLPPDIVRRSQCTYEFAVKSLWHPGSDTKASVTLNGTQVRFLDAMYTGDVYTIPLDNSVLKAGMNTLRIASESPAREKGGDYNCFDFKYHLLTVKPPSAGFIMTMSSKAEK